ncbi:hypothetical protein PAXINDRAFT_60528, partial [Paxillus involutus ATCC 200175]
SGKPAIPPIQVNARSLVWSPDGRQLIAGCQWECSLKFFDPSTGSLLAEWKGHTDVVHSVAVSRDGKFIASAPAGKTIRLWDTTTQQPIGLALEHDSYVFSVAISPDGNHLASGGDDQKVRIW